MRSGAAPHPSSFRYWFCIPFLKLVSYSQGAGKVLVFHTLKLEPFKEGGPQETQRSELSLVGQKQWGR